MGESSRGEAVSSGFRVGKVSTSSFPRTAVWTDAAGDSSSVTRQIERVGAVTFATTVQAPPTESADTRTHDLPPPPTAEAATPPWHDSERAVSASRPFFLRARGRATVFLVVAGVPLLLAYVAAHFFADALWFKELGQLSVLGHTIDGEGRAVPRCGWHRCRRRRNESDDRSFADQRRLDGPGDGCCCDGFDRRRDVLWVSRLEPLADIRALAASADVRRNGSAPRQGRWILRIHSAVRTRSREVLVRGRRGRRPGRFPGLLGTRRDHDSAASRDP